MQRYAVTGSTDTAGRGIIGIHCPSTVLRASVYYISIGNSTGTPADGALHCNVFFVTTTGTKTSVTPQGLVADEGAARYTAGENYTAQPTTSGIAVLELGFNQRSMYQWYAQEGGELVTDNVADNGLVVQFTAQTTGSAEPSSTMHFRE